MNSPLASTTSTSLRGTAMVSLWQQQFDRGAEHLRAGRLTQAQQALHAAWETAQQLLRQPEWITGQQRPSGLSHAERYMTAGHGLAECWQRQGEIEKSARLQTQIVRTLCRYYDERKEGDPGRRLRADLHLCLHLLTRQPWMSRISRSVIGELQAIVQGDKGLAFH